MTWVLGLDGGGTHARLALASREGRVLGPFMGGGINPFDKADWQEELQALFARAEVARHDVSRATCGMAGYGEGAEAAQEAALAALLPDTDLTVMNDVRLALEGALPEMPGVMILAGTGSMAWGRNAAGDELRVGGWNEHFSDEGSAYWLGLSALNQLSWCLDGREHDPAFAEAVLSELGVKDMLGVLDWYYALRHSRSSVAALARVVAALAEEGNPTAGAILDEAAHELARMAQAAHSRLGLNAEAAVSYAGGLFSSAALRERIAARVVPFARWREPKLTPLGGALLHAARRCGWPADEGWQQLVLKGLDTPEPDKKETA